MRLALLVLFFLSGFAALLYQVLWQRQLGLIFGNTAHAAATTLAVFFLGMALGSWLWGERAARTTRPLRLYAWLELGIAAAALAFFALLPAYRALYGPLFRILGESPLSFAFAKVLLASGVLLLPALCMGGTLPMMAQHVVRDPDQLGRSGTLLYGVNTLGGALGAFVAGFYLPAALGIRSSYLVAVGISAAVGLAALALSTGTPPASPRAEAATIDTDRPRPVAGRAVSALAFLSGFVSLGLEVLWTRMFAQVLHNSVYSFAAILVTFLVSLALGAAGAHALCRRTLRPQRVLYVLLLASGAAVALSPFAFFAATDGLAYVAPDAGWSVYVRAVFAVAALVMLGPGVLIGVIFPYLLHAGAPVDGSSGKTVGRLAALNTAGAIAGAVISGFVLLEWLGLWAGIKALGLLYLAAAALLAPAIPGLSRAVRILPLAGLLLFATVLDPTRLPIVRRAPGDAVLGEWESAYGVTAVVQNGTTRRLKMDNHYALGGTGALDYEATQADIPLVIHAAPRSIFFLGLGTGITAGAALRHPVDRLTAVELVPEVVEAARLHFAPYSNGLFTDPRARVAVGDARSFLLGTDQRYDVIIGDLFIPWQPAAGSLYTREHFEAVRDRLAPGGVFAQWLPLYQLSKGEFAVVAHTMLEVFAQVTLWRGDFLPDRPIVAMIGQADPTPLDPERLTENFRRRQGGETVPRAQVMALTALFYAGNLSATRDLFATAVVNTDDRPVIEYSSPITQREQRGNAAQWFVGEPLGAFYDLLAARVPAERDPYLARLSPAERGYVDAGRTLFRSKLAQAAGREEEARQLADTFAAEVPFEVYMMFQRRTALPASPR